MPSVVLAPRLSAFPLLAALVTAALWGFVPGVSAQPADAYEVAPPASWITPLYPDVTAEAPEHQVSGGVHYLLVDRQTRVDENDARYWHLALRVENEHGIQEAATVSVDFDPSYEQLTLHAVQVRRAGAVIDQLPRAKISVLQREDELEYQIYDGTQTVNLVLNDIRVGDVVEYSYTLRGQNPVFEGRFATRVTTEYSIPVHTYRYRLLWPSERQLFVRTHGTDLEPERIPAGAFEEYVWHLTDVAPKSADVGVPSWYEPYAWIQLSEWATWADLVEWGLPLYRPLPTSAVRAEARRIGQTTDHPAEQLVAALRFVQDDVRYMGIEMGRGSHEPRPPETVLAQRFGDCKDKTRLLITLLDELGIEAWPALVDTELRHTIDTWHPSPFAFDHVIVQAAVDGTSYWVDPTRQYQRGTLDRLAQADYGKALLLKPGTTAPVAMPPLASDFYGKEIEGTFDLREGIGEPGEFRVRTIYYGRDADNMRASLSAQSRDELERSYLNYYARSYPEIEVDEPMEVHDDDELNRLIVMESYTLPSAWTYDEAITGHTFAFYPSETSALFTYPGVSQRSMPRAIDHPVRVDETITVLLPESWPIEPEEVAVRDAAFDFELDLSYKSEIITAAHRYRSLSDHVRADDIAAHIKHLDEVDEALGYQLYTADDAAVAAGGVNWPMVFLVLLSLGIAAYAARSLYRYDPATLPLRPEARHPRLQGLSGWLILVGLSTVSMVVVSFSNIIVGLGAAAPGQWSTLTSPSSPAYHPLWAPLLSLELIGNAVFMVLAALGLVLFFKRRQSFPRVFVALLWSRWAFVSLDLALALLIPAMATMIGFREGWEVVSGLIGCTIWTLYMYQSTRVESTFIRRYDGRDEPDPAVADGATQGHVLA